MTVAELEKRVDALEKELANLRAIVGKSAEDRPWLRTFGVFANDPGFDEIVRLGRQWREEANQDRGE